MYEAQHALKRVLDAEHVSGARVGVGVLSVRMPVVVGMLSVRLMAAVSVGMLVFVSVMVAVLCHCVMP
ncbi:MAG: hypothetical protein OXE02_10930 [Chloroflexi bacterium]|nr:hypothetical protein [Chloroflexota bacterium]